MRGSIGNAVDAVGGIKAFLADQVPDADPDDQTPGQPKFASLQDMLAALDVAAYGSGWSIDSPRPARMQRRSTSARSWRSSRCSPPGAWRTRWSSTRSGADDREGRLCGRGPTATGVHFKGSDTSGADLSGAR